MNVGSKRVGEKPEAALFDADGGARIEGRLLFERLVEIRRRRATNKKRAQVDGTLVDSMPRFFPSWSDAGAVHGGLVMTEDAFYGYAGWPLPDIVRDVRGP